MSSSFTHLHVHTEFSLLDGAARLEELVAAAVQDGQESLGITDHGNMYGVLDFYKACRSQGVKPIIGTEAYMANESRTERPSRRGRVDDSGGETEGGKKLMYHLTLLAENQTGYKNMIQLASRAFLEGYYYKPRVDWEVLNDHREGLIATTGCLGGHVLQALLQDDYDSARKKAGRLQEIFGKESLFVELQDHGIPEQKRTNPSLVRLAKELGAPLVATNDSHYVNQEDAVAHDALLCVQTGSLMDDPGRFRFHGDQHYLKTAREMRELFRSLPDASDNTLLIAERCNVEIEFGSPQLPRFPIPEGFEDDDAYLQDLTLQGARKRWGNPLETSISDRLAYELKTIRDMGFSSYFLITWDLIRYARERGIRVGPGRGSAAGCAVAYSLGITDLDPIKYDLLFERFLNPDRVSMPDIDMDFDSRYRDELIRYVAEKYGRDRVAQIVTFSKIKARAAVRDAARVLGFPYALGDRVAKVMPPIVMGRDTPLAACLEEFDEYQDGYKAASELRDMYSSDPDVKKVVDVARGLEGLRRQDGIHAAAVVITRDPLTDYMPIQRKPESGQDPLEAPIVTQYEMHGVEDLGLLKMDFLGLRNLDVITDALELISVTRGIEINIEDIDLEDECTYQMLSRGESIGVFQFESGPLRSLMKSLVPSCFDDIAALCALYRPGPLAANMHNDYADRKNNRKAVQYFHKDAEMLLADTYGLMIYQESVMQVARKFAGYTLAQADNLRKACGKKDRELMQTERAGFLKGCEATGYGLDLGATLFDIIEQFADYAFPKSHSYGYGLIAYQTAYLKANYPLEYLAALLSSVKSNLDKAGVYLNECRLLGIDVTVPDINLADSNFMPVPNSGNDNHLGQIVFGLSAIRNVGEGLVDLIVSERKDNGPFLDFYDFLQRCDSTVLNKRTIESLIKAGSFDSMNHPRQGLLYVYEEVIDQTLARRKEHDMGVLSLFGELDEEFDFDERKAVPDIEFEKSTRLAFEKEMLGLYVSDHPLSGYERQINHQVDISILELLEKLDDSTYIVGGVVSALDKKWTRKGDLMATFQLEDLSAAIEVTIFPRTMSEYGHKLEDDAVLLLKGHLDSRSEAAKLICQEINIFDSADSSKSRSVYLRLPTERVNEESIDALKAVLRAHPGKSEVFLNLGNKKTLQLPDEFLVDVESGLVGELLVLLGKDTVRLS